MVLDGAIETEDGVAVVKRGDLFQILYNAPARLHRTRWLFDRVEARTMGREFVALLVVLSTSDPPDAATRAENTARLREIGPRLRRLVTVPVGDTFHGSIVRTIMRTLALVQGHGRTHFIRNTIDDGVACVLQAAGPSTPSVTRIREDLNAMFGALDLQAPRPSPEWPASLP
jgi:hypothetical protein